MMLQLTGCASIVSGTQQKVEVTTGNVKGANCELENNKGKWSVNTPETVAIHRSYGDVKVNCQKAGKVGGKNFASNTKPLVFGNGDNPVEYELLK